MSKTLIVFGTRYGATAEVAQVVAKILKEQYGGDKIRSWAKKVGALFSSK